MKKIIYIFLLTFCISADYMILDTYSNISNTDIIDQNDLESINILFEEETFKYDFGSIINSNLSCPDNECALTELKKTNHNFIIFSRIIKLGDKLRFSGSILDNEGVVYTSKVILMNISEMEEGVMRLVKSLALKESIDEVANIDNIIPSEKVETDRIKSFYKTGFSIGYMYPTFDSFATREFENDYYYDSDETLTISNQSQKIKIAAMYMYDFKENSSLLMEVLGYLGSTPSFGVNASYLKFLNKENNSKFIGGSIGVQYVPYCVNCNTNLIPSEHRRSGISVSAQAGYMFFRTYDINVLARLQYHVVLNTDIDQGIVLDIGVLKKAKPKSQQAERSPLQKVATSIGNTYLFFLVIGFLAML